MAPGAIRPQPPRPIQGQHSPGKTLLIVGVVLGTILVTSVLAIYTGVRMLSHSISVREVRGARGNKEVSIKTPVGSVEIHQGSDADVGLLGLPIYPGAKRVTHNGNASISADLAGQKLVGVLAARFETGDPVYKVRDFYRNQLSATLTHYVLKDSEGKTVFEIRTAGEEKIVTLEREGGGTRIGLIKIVQGNNQAN